MADKPSTPPAGPGGLLSQIDPLYYLLAAIPVAFVLRFLGESFGLWVFIFSCAAIIPLAGLMGRATENLAETMGAGIGGLLNATFGNAAELIIALMALYSAMNLQHTGNPEDAVKALQMLDLVKASITGSIIGNILLVLGLSILVGGLFHKRQTFNQAGASMGATMMLLAGIALLVPTLYFEIFQHERGHGLESGILYLSDEIAVILIVVYALSLFFSLRTHQHLFAGSEEQLPTTGEHHQPEWSRKTSLIVLVIATVGVAVMSEMLIHSVEEAAKALHMNHVFIGVIVVAVVGNAAEHSTAVLVAAKNKMDLAVNIAIGSSIQIALFVAPVLLFASLLMGHRPPLDFHFSLMEVIAVVISILAVAAVAQDGECHWMEGVMLLAVYVILGLTFYHLPATGGAAH